MIAMPARVRLGGAPRIAMAVCAITAAVLLSVMSVHTNLERACITQDTPSLDLCDRRKPGIAEEAEALRARIARNPGDANAYRELAFKDLSAAHLARVETAARLSPQEPNLLL